MNLIVRKKKLNLKRKILNNIIGNIKKGRKGRKIVMYLVMIV